MAKASTSAIQVAANTGHFSKNVPADVGKGLEPSDFALIAAAALLSRHGYQMATAKESGSPGGGVKETPKVWG